MYRARFSKEKEPGSQPLISGWQVPVLAVMMLVFGIAIGYLSRPALEARFAGPTATAADTAAASATGDSAELEALRVELQAQTRHYLGSEDAPVTLIEFGDFH